jgi:CDP-6-deoxy-D-xylo-4-hexulose-3-dehydrase
MLKNDEIKKVIIDNVKLYYKEKFTKRVEFKPGETPIRYGGRYFDEKELIYLIESSLEFWLNNFWLFS